MKTNKIFYDKLGIVLLIGSPYNLKIGCSRKTNEPSGVRLMMAKDGIK